MQETAERHGGIAQFRVLRRRVVVISDRELAQQVLLAGWERYARGVHNRNLGIVSGEGLLSTEGEDGDSAAARYSPPFGANVWSGWSRSSPRVGRSDSRGMGAPERVGKANPPGRRHVRLTMRAMGRMLLSANIPEDQGARIGVILRDGLMLLRKRNTSSWPAPMWLPTPANRRLVGYRDELTSSWRRICSRGSTTGRRDRPTFWRSLLDPVIPTPASHSPVSS